MPLPSFAADLSGLELLLNVAKLGSVGQAAAAHGISQPAASAKLRELERRLGLRLLDRGPRGSTLTPTGGLVADWARSTVDAAEALAAGVAALRSANDSRLAVASSQTVAEYLLPAWLVALRAGSPALSVTLRAANSADVAAAVLAGDVSLGFVEGPDLPPGLTCAQVGSDRLTVVVGRAHPWARRRRAVTGEELAAAAMVSREAGSGTRRAFEEELPFPPIAPALELSSTTAIKHAVAAGTCAAVLSSLAITAEIAAGELIAVPCALPLRRKLRVIWPVNAQLTGPARDLYAIAVR